MEHEKEILPMHEICDLLRHLNDNGFLPMRCLEKSIVVSERGGYRYLVKTRLDAKQFKLLFQSQYPGMDHNAVQAALLHFLFHGTSWRAYKEIPVSATDDHDFDTRQAFDAASRALTAAGEMLESYRDADKSGLSRIDREDLAAIHATLQLAAAKIPAALKAASLLCRTQATLTK